MIKTYDPAEVLTTFFGIPLTGFADGTFVEVDYNEDAFTLMVGAGGETARARSQNRSGTVTFTLMASSPCNDLLSAVAIADRASGLGVGPVGIKDNNGTSLVAGANAWVKKMPKVEYAKEVGSRQWVLECDALDMLVGSIT